MKDRNHWFRIFAYFALAIMYISPGGSYLFQGSHTAVLSDGTDPATLPYSYSIILDHLKTKPTNLLFGAVPTERLNPPEGFSIWLPWMEKIVVAIGSLFTPLEQLSTLYVVIILFLNGVAFYIMGLALGWSRSLSFALGIAFAFSAYTRARAQVHFGLAGVYHLPLLVLAIHWITSFRDRKSLVHASLLLLLAATVVHYYLIITAFLAPVFLVLVYLNIRSQKDKIHSWVRLGLASLPAVALVGWSYLKPLPKEFIKKDTITTLRTGETTSGTVHPFMYRFASRGVDYFTGDLAVGLNDVNPIRQYLSGYVLRNIGESNSHERANGVRWFIWGLFFFALVSLFKARDKASMPQELKRNILFFSAFAGFAIWLSFSPSFLGSEWGASRWLYALVSQIRVPSRSGVYAHFAILMAVGYFLNWYIKLERKDWLVKLLKLSGALATIVILELPPFLNAMPIAAVQPVRRELSAKKLGSCGAGLYFPYISGTWELLPYYHFLQSMRESSCMIVNAVTETTSDRNQLLLKFAPLHPEVIRLIQRGDTQLMDRLIQLARCVPLQWIVFDPQVPGEWSQNVCGRLGWSMVSQDTCLDSQPVRRAIERPPETCFAK